MKLYAIDQVSISSVQADTIKPGQPFEVSDDYGKELLSKLPNAVSKDPPKEKAEPAHKNKADPKPANKAGRGGGANKADS